MLKRKLTLTPARVAALRQLDPVDPRPVLGRGGSTLSTLDAAGLIRFVGARAVSPRRLDLHSLYVITAAGQRRLAEWERASPRGTEVLS